MGAAAPARPRPAPRPRPLTVRQQVAGIKWRERVTPARQKGGGGGGAEAGVAGGTPCCHWCCGGGHGPGAHWVVHLDVIIVVSATPPRPGVQGGKLQLACTLRYAPYFLQARMCTCTQTTAGPPTVGHCTQIGRTHKASNLCRSCQPRSAYMAEKDWAKIGQARVMHACLRVC